MLTVQSDDDQPTDSSAQQDEWEKLRSKWLIRLAVLAVSGLMIVLVYGFQSWTTGRVVAAAGLGLMAGGAAWLSGALTGFLFGIPHAREAIASRRAQQKRDTDEDLSDEDEEDIRYRPSTSLEQIADWLTKIIVGVGLTQLNHIPGKLDALAAYIASGMGSDQANKPFALAIVIYFFVSGFLFGFLWSRLYMLRAFAEAEILKAIAKISQFDFDSEAINLVNRQLTTDAPAVSPRTLKGAIKKASAKAREAILEKAKEARTASGVTVDLLRRASEVFKALISEDTEDLDHESHAQLGYILRDLGKPEDSVEEFSHAIKIRDRRGKRGWSSYDFRRACIRIKLDEDSPSKPAVRDAILADLRRARKDPKREEDWEKRKDDIHEWLKKNNLDETSLDDAERPT